MTVPEPLEGRRILVIEDEYLLAEMLCELLGDLGATPVGPIGYQSDALAFVGNAANDFDAVILDINLHGQMSYGIADALVKRRVHFVFATGYGTHAVAEAYQGFPRCEKPFSAKALVAALGAAPASH
jgi:CheY-like chemotaxis protein